MSAPNFFIVGAPKCGTTALSEYLHEHPNIFICSPKEPHYFATDIPNYREVDTEEKYLALFDKATPEHLAIGEASVFYLYSKEAIKNIMKFNKNVKIIVMLRNPVELAYSMHSQLLLSRDEDEMDFTKAWDLIDLRKKGLKLPKYCRDVKLLYYDEIAKLGDQLERLVSVFPKEQIKIIFSENFFEDTCAVYEEVLSFLGLPDDNRNYFPKINQNKHHEVMWLGNLTQRPPKRLVRLAFEIKKFIRLDRLGILNALRKINIKKNQRQPLPDSYKKKILKVYHKDIVKLSQLTGRNLDSWEE